MYAAPDTSMGVWSFGITDESMLRKIVHIDITILKPAKIPKLKGSALLKPRRPAFDNDIILFGPGVAAVIIA